MRFHWILSGFGSARNGDDGTARGRASVPKERRGGGGRKKERTADGKAPVTGLCISTKKKL